MEFVGKTVRKEFKGFGVFSGVVNAYDSSTGFFEVLYEDGDSEELELSEIALLLEGSGTIVNDGQSGAGEVTRVGRKPRKRRRFQTHGDSGNASANLMSDRCLEETGEEIQLGFCGVGGNLRETHSVNGNLNFSSGCNGVRSNNLLNLNDGLDLNNELSLNDGFNLNGGFNSNEGSLKKNGFIDLNLDANGDFEENLEEGDSGVSVGGTQKREHCFDLNLGLDTDFEGQLVENNSFYVVDKTPKVEMCGGIEKVQMEGNSRNGEGTQTGAGCRPCGNAAGDSYVGLEEEVPKESGGSLVFKGGDSSGAMYAKDFMSSEIQTRETNSETGTPLEHGSQENLESACKERKRRKRRKPLDDVNYAKERVLRRGSSRMEVAVSAENHVLSGVTTLSHNEVSPPGATDAKDFLSSEVQVEEGFSDGTTLDHGYGGNSGSTRKETYGRKKRKLLDNVNSATGKVLRRSSRRLAASLYDQNHVSSEAQPSPAVSEILEEKPSTIVCEESEEDSVLPSKLPLPPSSKNLNLDGIPIFDLFSVYACLRSFSASLFLSPFELEDFVASLQCNVPTLLLDSVHVSLLQTMRKHLEFLSDENSESASDCLRSLNWDMLDLITWPMFMVEYLIMHGSRLMPGVDLCKLKLFESEYYKQPVSVKIEILRCLCDDVVEVEAIRSELNRRTLAIELNIDTDRSMRIETFKRRTSMDVSGGSCLSEEVVEETTDWNSDECCLCKMDGNLICCDGCPEAYHLRCLGVTNSALPEGDWYCPECRIDRDKPWLKLGKSLRGAELLGVDPYGRLYYSSCGYLLVSDSCNDESSYRYYSRNDLTSVIEALKSFDTLYSPILGAISKQWNVFISSTGANSHVDYNNPTVCSELVLGQMPSNLVLPLNLAPSETFVRNEIIDEGKPQMNYIASQYSGSIDSEISASVNNNPVTLNNFVKMENPLASSEGSAAMSQATRIQSLAKTGTDDFNLSAGGSNHFEIQGKLISDSSLTSTDLDAEQGKNIKSADCGHIASMTETKKVAISQGLLRIGYVNYYSFARTASLVAEELTRKSSGKIHVGSTKTVEDIILAQLKAISKKATKFSWPNLQNPNVDTRKEKCGWCFSCKAPDEDRDCFFNMNESAQDLPCEAVGLCSKWNKKGHHVDVMCYILCLEDRLRGFLLGPWLNPHYTDLWRKSVVMASDVASLKHLLLVLESNLRPLALSAEWLKHVDSVATVGSASHVVTSSKYGIGRKRARYSDSDPQPSLKAAAGLGLFWWRGGRLSRDLFNWKVLPQSLASKAARQAGCTKIPGVLYPDSSESTNRSKYIVWRAAVERSRSVEQLALQVRELDANIRWDDIENTNLLSKMDQFRKSVRPFKKVIIRRKCTEGTVMKYLLDFGKRRIIPDIVVTHGSKVEESSSGRKKYWLEEPHVPLHLLKAFEERRIARKSNKMNYGKLNASCGVTKKTSKRKGFSYLFEKAERSENYQCGHCNKDVLIREAVSCQYCKGFFHTRHVRKSTRANTANCKYTCHKCQGGNHVKVEGKKGISLSQKSKAGSAICRVLRSSTRKKASKDKKPADRQKKRKDAVAIPLRRSARRLAHVSLQNKKLGGNKKGKGKGKGKWERKGKGKGKQIKLRNGLLEKSEKGTWQKKRTQVYRAYWLNGLLLSRKPNDDRVVNFRSKNLVAPREELTAILGQPKCSLCCEQEFSLVSNYVSCQICGDWFHGDAFGLSVENVGMVIGFMCHKCRNRTPPVCPNLQRKTSDEAQFGESNEKAGIDCAEEVSKIDEFHMDEESNDRCLVDESSQKDQELETVSNLSQVNSENEHLLKIDEQKGNAIPIPNANEHVPFVESTTDMVRGET